MIRCRIDEITPPAGRVIEGVAFIELPALPQVGSTIIIKKEGSKDLVFALMAANVVVQEGQEPLYGLGCQRVNMGGIVPAPAHAMPPMRPQ